MTGAKTAATAVTAVTISAVEYRVGGLGTCQRVVYIHRGFRVLIQQSRDQDVCMCIIF